MPFLNDKPSFLSKPSNLEPMRKPGVNGESAFGARPQAERFGHEGHQLKSSLGKNAEIRHELAKSLNLKPDSPEMDAQIKKMDREILKSKLGGYANRSKQEKAVVQEYWESKNPVSEMEKTNMNTRSIKTSIATEKKRGFLKKIFGGK